MIERIEGRIYLRLQAEQMGADLCIIITGGDRPHLGAVAVAQVGESLALPGKISPTVSNITLPGHKEDTLARSVASRVATVISANVVVCCGIHVDNILPEEIDRILTLCDAMTTELIESGSHLSTQIGENI